MLFTPIPIDSFIHRLLDHSSSSLSLSMLSSNVHSSSNSAINTSALALPTINTTKKMSRYRSTRNNPSGITPSYWRSIVAEAKRRCTRHIDWRDDVFRDSLNERSVGKLLPTRSLRSRSMMTNKNSSTTTTSRLVRGTSSSSSSSLLDLHHLLLSTQSDNSVKLAPLYLQSTSEANQIKPTRTLLLQATQLPVTRHQSSKPLGIPSEP
ncbi:hypothetical protein BDF22DRAFT_774573 [Syncephalis plumigaleata]|nr:hypothetical protein BDF22DRAFT_774573 [Syncephalis plumigaleata]